MWLSLEQKCGEVILDYTVGPIHAHRSSKAENLWDSDQKKRRETEVGQGDATILALKMEEGDYRHLWKLEKAQKWVFS